MRQFLRTALSATISVLIIGNAAGCLPPEQPGKTSSLSIRADGPTDIAFAPNGDMYFTEKSGTLKVLWDGARKPKVVANVDVPPIDGYSETGLLGIALSPDFERDKAIYLYRTFSAPGIHTDYAMTNRVVRLSLTDPADQQVIVKDLPGGLIHNAGKLAFGPDGKLYVAVGDANDKPRAQEVRFLNGKVLRYNPDGSIPGDNPFPGSPVYSYGHRNIFGMAFDPSGRLYVTENGPDSNDEVNLIEKGKNYGWPNVTGDSGGRYADPLVVFKNVIVPTGIIYFKKSGSYLRDLAGKMLFGDYLKGDVHALWWQGGKPRSKVVFNTGKPITAMAQAPDGRLWIGQEGRIYEVNGR